MEKIPSDKEMLEMLESIDDEIWDTADRLHRAARELNRNVNALVSRPKGEDTL